MMNEHLFIVLAKEHYNPLNAIRSLGEKGINPIFIAIKTKTTVSSKSKYISKTHYVENIEEAYELLLKEYGNSDESRKPFLFCTDDYSIGYLDSHYDEIKDKFIYFNAGKKDGINKYMDKGEILNLAGKHGLNYASTVVCNKGDIPKDIQYPIITKSISPNIGGWKSDVFICHSEDELKDAYMKIKAPQVLIQQYIDKKNELEYYGMSIKHGEQVLISTANDYLYLIPGYYSPYMNTFEPPYPDVQQKIAAMIKEIGFEGIFSVEFLRDADDKLYFLEINLRIPTWTYASTCAGMNLPYLWALSMLNSDIPADAKKAFEPFKAVVEPIDYQKRVVERGYDYKEWIIDVINCKCHYYYNAEDPEPFYEMVRNNENMR